MGKTTLYVIARAREDPKKFWIECAECNGMAFLRYDYRKMSCYHLIIESGLEKWEEVLGCEFKCEHCGAYVDVTDVNNAEAYTRVKKNIR